MAYHEAHAERLRRALSGRRAITEKKMFGGVCFMLRDHMLCGTGWEGFLFRVGEEREAIALTRPGAKPMEIGGRKMRGFVWVDPAQCQARDLARWLALAEGYVAALPAKPSGKRGTTTKQKSRKAGSKKAPLRSARPSRNPPAG
jgi:TfoX N-terminal domain